MLDRILSVVAFCVVLAAVFLLHQNGRFISAVIALLIGIFWVLWKTERNLSRFMEKLEIVTRPKSEGSDAQ